MTCDRIALYVAPDGRSRTYPFPSNTITPPEWITLDGVVFELKATLTGESPDDIDAARRARATRVLTYAERMGAA